MRTIVTLQDTLATKVVPVIDTTDPVVLPNVGDLLNAIPDPNVPTTRVAVVISERSFVYFTGNPANVWGEVYLSTDSPF